MIDNLSTQRYPSLFDLPNNCKYFFYEEDLATFDLISLIEKDDIVIHLAAITDATSSFNNSEFVRTHNFNVTRRISEACYRSGAKLIFISSTSVYGTQEKMVSEDCLESDLKPQSPYAFTKLEEEKFIQKLSQDLKLKSVIFRFGTIFGASPGIRFHTAVNKFCWQATMGIPLTVWTTAYDQKRPYLDLSDGLNAIKIVISKNLFNGELFNVVSLNLSVREVIEVIKEFKPRCEIEFVDDRIMNQLSYEVSYHKLSQVGYQPVADLRESINSTLKLIGQSNFPTKL